MRLNPALFLLSGLFSASALSAQTTISPVIIDEPNPADFEMVAEETPPTFAAVTPATPEPLPPTQEADNSTDQYRSVVESLRENRHQFIHCKLKNGKILTGLPRDVGATGFSVHTDIFAETYVRYDDLAKAPRPVLAVGTRIKQGAELTGIVTFVVVFFIPLALIGVIPSC